MKTAEPTAPDAARELPRAADDRAPREQRRAVAALAAVAVAYVVAQVLLFAMDRPFSWDEVVYLVQTQPGEIAMDWGPQRARGIVVLVAPVALLGASTEVVRWYLVIVSGLMLLGAFWPWVRVVGPAAVLGAAAFAFSWVGLYFGMEVFPNLPAAFATIATAGSLAAYARAPRRGALLGIAIGIALVALFRPSDSVFLAAFLLAGASAVAVWRHRSWRGPVAMAGALAVGGLAGWLPWLIEMSLRYGSPLAAVAAARAEAASGRPRDDLDQYLNLVGGPARLIVEDPTLTYPALAALLLVGALVVAALVGKQHRPAAVVAVLGMSGGLVPYIVLHTGVNLRYLLPAWGLACVAMGIGGMALWHGAGRIWVAKQLRWTSLAVLVLVAVVFTGANLKVAHRNAGIAAIDQAGMYEVAAEVADRADGRPCAFVTEFGFPQIAWATDCIGLEMDVYGETGQCPGATHSVSDLAKQGYEIFAMARNKLPPDLMISEWESQRMRVRGYGPWRIYLPSDEQLAQGPLPRVPRPGEHSVPCPLSRAPLAEQIAPLRIGPRLPDDSTLRYRQRRLELGEEASWPLAFALPPLTGRSPE